MSIYDRWEEFPLHQVSAMLAECKRGSLLKQTAIDRVKAGYVISAAEETELSDLIDDVIAGTKDPRHFEEAYMLVETGFYTLAEAKTSVGV